MSTECLPTVPLEPARRPRRAAAAANPHVQFHPPGQRHRHGQAQAAPTSTPEEAVNQPTVTLPMGHGIRSQLPTIPVRVPHQAQARVPVPRIPSNVTEISRSSSFTAASDQPTRSLTSSPPHPLYHSLSCFSSRPPSLASSLSCPTSPTSSSSSRSQSPRAGPHSKSKRVSKRRKDSNDDSNDTGADVKKSFRVNSKSKLRYCLFCEYVVIYNCHSSVTDLSRRQKPCKPKVYKESTGSGNLRKHLYSKHCVDWFSSCDELGVEITAEDKKLRSLLADYRQQHNQAAKPESDGHISRQKYTPEAFVDAIVKFIVADDQVCFVESYSY